MQSHYGTWMPIKEGATIPLASAVGRLPYLHFECRLSGKADPENSLSGKADPENS
jgi:hypothetical protein